LGIIGDFAVAVSATASIDRPRLFRKTTMLQKVVKIGAVEWVKHSAAILKSLG
jgi:hypothetical protein